VVVVDDAMKNGNKQQRTKQAKTTCHQPQHNFTNNYHTTKRKTFIVIIIIMLSDSGCIRFLLVPMIVILLLLLCCEKKICHAFVTVVPSSAVPQQRQQQHGNALLLLVRSTRHRRRRRHTSLFYSDKDSLARDALERTAAHLERLKQLERTTTTTATTDNSSGYDDDDVDAISKDPRYASLYQGFIRQSANALKEQLKHYQLPRNGRKPALARRLARHEIQKTLNIDIDSDVIDIAAEELLVSSREVASSVSSSSSSSSLLGDGFSSLFSSSSSLSDAACVALKMAHFLHAPSRIQTTAIPSLVAGESLILHAATGSGKTLAYLLPITERLWREQQNHQRRQPARRGRGSIIGGGSGDDDDSSSSSSLMLILTPTRELAAQVAGIATVLAPPGTVRFVSRPTNLLSTTAKDQGEMNEYGGRRDDDNGSTSPRLYIGSAKTMQYSLYGDGGKTMPASPTPKPLAMEFLQRVDCCVLDEVDRMLQIAKTKSDKKIRANRDDRHQHERPAAVITAAILRLAIGRRVQIVAASATVGRPLKRELARVMGLSPQDCPRVIVATTNTADAEEENVSAKDENDADHDAAHSRAVTIPESVQNYLVPVQDGTSDGKLLTAVAAVIHALNDNNKKHRRILLVLSRGGFEMSTRNVIGALKHFNCQPEPTSLLDALEADGTDRMMQVHRQVSKSVGVGVGATSVSSSTSSDIVGNSGNKDEGYLLVTGEDTIRGLHLEGLDVVISVGRPQGPDEYTHIAGRTGRQGRRGIVLNIVSDQKAATMKSWQRMLNVEFTTLDLQDVGRL
jgi:superfamily II DNA/RNA helicase